MAFLLLAKISKWTVTHAALFFSARERYDAKVSFAATDDATRLSKVDRYEYFALPPFWPRSTKSQHH